MLRPCTAAAWLLAAALGLIGAASAQTSTPQPAENSTQHAPDETLAENARARLTRGDYDADIQRVPAASRDAFASDPKRLSAYLTNLLIVKTLAADARQAGLDNDPQLKVRIALEVDRVLADAQLRHLEQLAEKEFDAKSSDFAVKAKEIYLVDANKFRVPEQISASQIVFDTKKRTPEEALALAQQTRSKLLAGADFAATAKEVSDDPLAQKTGGDLGWFGRARIDPSVSQAAFDMKNVGDISEPIQSPFGYHLIRLEGRRPAHVRPFEEVKPQIMADLRKRYAEEQRDARTNAIRSDPNLKVNQPAVDSLVFYPKPGTFGFGMERRVKPDSP